MKRLIRSVYLNLIHLLQICPTSLVLLGLGPPFLACGTALSPLLFQVRVQKVLEREGEQFIASPVLGQIRPVSYADEDILVGEEVDRRMSWARMNGRVVA